jgi:hypothetical protein
MRVVAAGILVLIGLAALGVAAVAAYGLFHEPAHVQQSVGPNGTIHTHFHDASVYPWALVGGALVVAYGCFHGAYAAWQDD